MELVAEMSVYSVGGAARARMTDDSCFIFSPDLRMRKLSRRE